jgi:predicted ester cyclase
MEPTLQQQHELSLKNACVKFMFAYQQRNADKMLTYCDPDGEVYFQPLGNAGKGKIGALGKAIWAGLIESFPDIDNTLDAAVAEADDTVRCQVVIRGTQAKDFADVPNKGLRFDSDHIFIFHLNEDNKIDNIKISWDHADFRKQLGAE